MKKLITISVITIVVLAVAIVESVFTYNTYSSIRAEASELCAILKGRNKDVHNDERVLEIVNKIEEDWNEYSTIAYACANHATVKNVNEKIVSLKSYVIADAAEDAYATTCILSDLASALAKENLPLWGNLL